MISARLLLLVTVVAYGTQNASTFKLLKKLLAKHLQPDSEGKSLIADDEVYFPPGPYKLDDGPVIEWNGRPVLPGIENDGTTDGSEASADVSAETRSEEVYAGDNGPETSDDRQPDAADANGPDGSIKRRLCDKVELIKSVISSVRQKVKSAKETTGVDAPDSSFLYENGGDGTPTSADVPKYTVPTVKFTASTPPFVHVQPTSTPRPDRDDCTADAHGKVVVERHNGPAVVVVVVAVVGSPPPPPPLTPHTVHYDYYSPSPCRHHQQQPWPTNRPPQPDRQIGYDRPDVRYAPHTTDGGAAWTRENVPYHAQARPGDVDGAGRWIGRHGYDEYGPVSSGPAVPYYGGYVVPPPRTDMAAGPQAKPIVAMLRPADADGADVRAALPTTNGGVGAATTSVSADGGLAADYEYPPSRGDVPLQWDEPAGRTQDDVHGDAAPKERRQVGGRGDAPSGKTPAVPATSSESVDAVTSRSTSE